MYIATEQHFSEEQYWRDYVRDLAGQAEPQVDRLEAMLAEVVAEIVSLQPPPGPLATGLSGEVLHGPAGAGGHVAN